MKIEELLKKSRQQLDAEDVPPVVWNKVLAGWKKPKKDHSTSWKVAAAVLLVAVLGLLLRNQQLQSKVETLASLGDISEEYASIEANYQSEIQILESEIPIELVREQAEFDWVLEELELLDQVNKIYRSDIGKVNNDQLIPTLLDYYEKKIKLLKRLQLEIQRQNKHEDNETNSNSGAAA